MEAIWCFKVIFVFFFLWKDIFKYRKLLLTSPLLISPSGYRSMCLLMKNITVINPPLIIIFHINLLTFLQNTAFLIEMDHEKFFKYNADQNVL